MKIKKKWKGSTHKFMEKNFQLTKKKKNLTLFLYGTPLATNKHTRSNAGVEASRSESK